MRNASAFEERFDLDFLRSSTASRRALGATVFASTFLLVLLGIILYNFWLDSALRASAPSSSWQEYLQGEALVVAIVFQLVEALACLALIAIIKSAFLASMRNRVHQLGLLATTGATPKQLRRLLVGEALTANALPLLAVAVLGALGAGVFIGASLDLASKTIPGQALIEYQCPPLLLVLLTLLSLTTVLASAGLPARKLAKTTPLQAVSGSYEADNPSLHAAKLPTRHAAARPSRHAEKRPLRHTQHGPRIGGIEVQLARESMRARKAALRASKVALFLALVSLGVFLSFMTVSKASVDETYYQRYGTPWTLTADVPHASQDELEAVARELEQAGAAQRTLVEKSDAGMRIYALSGADVSLAVATEATARSLARAGFNDFTVVDLAEEKRKSEAIWQGWSAVFGGFCALLALVGMVGVLTQAACSVTQRGREFARLRSLGLAPSGVTRMLAFEAVLLVSRPLLAALPFVAAAALALTALANQQLTNFAAAFPWGAALGFLALLFAAALAAYALGAWRINRSDLAAALKDNALT